jgi:molybdenum cofactor guanylyltransferase
MEISTINNLTGIILSGGKSSRMGLNKALIEIDGIKIIERIYNILKKITTNIIISSNTDVYTFLQEQYIEDEIKGIGPIGGLYSCLKKSSTKYNIVTTCDMPFIPIQLYKLFVSLSEGYDATVPLFNDNIEPLVGVYNVSTLSFIENAINQKEYSVQNLLKKMNCKLIKVDESLEYFRKDYFININTREDLEKLYII